MKKSFIVVMVCGALLVSATAWALNRNEEIRITSSLWVDQN